MDFVNPVRIKQFRLNASRTYFSWLAAWSVVCGEVQSLTSTKGGPSMPVSWSFSIISSRSFFTSWNYVSMSLIFILFDSFNNGCITCFSPSFPGSCSQVSTWVIHAKFLILNSPQKPMCSRLGLLRSINGRWKNLYKVRASRSPFFYWWCVFGEGNCENPVPSSSPISFASWPCMELYCSSVFPCYIPKATKPTDHSLKPPKY